MASASASPAECAAASVLDPLAVALLTLTFTTGLIDAVSYLGLGRVFTANMTGNIVLLGFGVAGAGGLPVVAPLVSLGAFLVGAAAGGRLAVKLAGRHRAHFGTTLAIESALLVVATVIAATVDIRPGAASGDCLVALLAMAMGIRNATVRKIAVPDLTTTVLTMTLTGLAADSVIGGGTGKGTTRRSSAVVTLLVGALVGALLIKASLAWALALAAALALALLTLATYTRGAGEPV
jgi:uncharacterized membrane protein YoaK (UPF0700 family)